MSDSLDFDELCALYKSDPEQFEKFRKDKIDQFISSSPSHHQTRLRGLQFQVDAKREVNKHKPIVACMEISKMMHESLDELRYQLNQLTGNSEQLRYQNQQRGWQDGQVASNAKADILSFPNM